MRVAPRGRQRGFILNPYAFGAAGGSDPNFASVVLLAHMEGLNLGTTFLDSSGSPKTITPNGGVHTGTATAQFGSSSAGFDGAGDFLTVADHADFDFGSGDFTIEAWIKRNATPGVAFGLFTKRTSNAFHAPFNLEITSGNLLKAQVSTTGSSWAQTLTSAGTPFNTFFHAAIVRQGTTLYLFLGGVLSASGALTGALMTNTAPLVIGATDAAGNYSHNGYIDEARITKGVARYTSAFTPPTSAFPDS